MPQTKVDAEQKKEICDLYALGIYTQTEIAGKFGIDQTSVSRIVSLRQEKDKSNVA